MSTSVIVIPCHDEAARLDIAAFKSFAAARSDITLLFVDDGSRDTTLKLLQDLAASNPQRFRVLALSQNMGKAEAVRHGLLEACTAQPGNTRPTYTGFWDADLATPLEDITAFADLLDARPGIDMVFGSRVNLLGRNVRRGLLRHYIGRVFATFAAAALGVGIYDTQCGAKMFRISDHFIAQLQEPYFAGWIFDVEMIAREIKSRKAASLPPVQQAIYEYPLTQWRDVAGSKLKPSDFFRVGIALIRVWWKYRR